MLIVQVSKTDAQVGDVTYILAPCIIEQNGTYYLFSTGQNISIRRSNDLYYWEEYVGSVFDAIPDWAITEVPGVENIWAPNIFYNNGTYYLC
jgi:arabinan endo-1,5-alpha-L-arabinosidase